MGRILTFAITAFVFSMLILSVCVPADSTELSSKDNQSSKVDVTVLNADQIDTAVANRDKSVKDILSTADQQVAIIKSLKHTSNIFLGNVASADRVPVLVAEQRMALCAAALGRLRATEAIPWLITYSRLAGPSDDYRSLRPCLASLVDIGSPSLMPVLQGILDENSPLYLKIRVGDSVVVIQSILGKDAGIAFVRANSKNIHGGEPAKRKEQLIAMLLRSDGKDIFLSE